MTEQAKELGKHPVNPYTIEGQNEHGICSTTWSGITLREYMATHILAGIMANPERYKYISELGNVYSNEDLTKKNVNKALYFTNALLEELAKTDEQIEKEALDKAFEESTKPNQEICDLPL